MDPFKTNRSIRIDKDPVRDISIAGRTRIPVGRLVGHTHKPSRPRNIPASEREDLDPRVELLDVLDDGSEVWLIDPEIVELEFRKGVQYPADATLYRFIPRGEIWVDQRD